MASGVVPTVTGPPSFCSCSPVGWQPLHRQRGSVAGLTFPFSCSQSAPARPIHPNRVLLFEWPLGGGGSGGGAGGWRVVGDLPQLDGWFRAAFKRGVRTTTQGICVMSVQARKQRLPHLPNLSLWGKKGLMVAPSPGLVPNVNCLAGGSEGLFCLQSLFLHTAG